MNLLFKVGDFQVPAVSFRGGVLVLNRYDCYEAPSFFMSGI